VNYDNSLVVTITVTCYSWAPVKWRLFLACGQWCVRVIFVEPESKARVRMESGSSKIFSSQSHEMNCVCPSRTQRFCKNDSDSNIESLTVTRVESSHSVKNVTQLESSHHFSQCESNIFPSITRVVSESPIIVTRVIDSSSSITACGDISWPAHTNRN